MPNATKPVQNTEKAQHIHDPALTARRVIAYIVLFFLSFLCLFFFYVLIVNSTHNNFTIQQGFDPMPRGSFGTNFYNTTHDSDLPAQQSDRLCGQRSAVGVFQRADGLRHLRL